MLVQTILRKDGFRSRASFLCAARLTSDGRGARVLAEQFLDRKLLSDALPLLPLRSDSALPQKVVCETTHAMTGEGIVGTPQKLWSRNLLVASKDSAHLDCWSE